MTTTYPKEDNMEIDLGSTWESVLPILLLVWKDAETPQGREDAFQELKKMARLADLFGQDIMIEVYTMAGDTLAEGEAEYYDVLLRPDGGDPILEFENRTWEEADAIVESLQRKLPSAGYEEIRG